MSAYWTPDRIRQAMQDWNQQHGGQPKMESWRRATPFTPSAQTVVTVFGSWNVAIVSAGFVANRQGPHKLVGTA